MSVGGILRRMMAGWRPPLPEPGDEIVSLRLLHQDARTRIFFTAARIDSIHAATASGWQRVLQYMRPDDRIIWTTFWHVDEPYFQNAREFHKQLPVPLENIWVLGNTEAEVHAAAGAGFRSSWVHNNCWLDEHLFRPIALPKEHRAVMIAQAVDYKRPWLAAKVKDLAYVETERFHLSTPADTSSLVHAKTFRNLPANDLIRLINQSHVGLMLSEIEGGSYASSEYLMCGIPVVSTPSIRGRDLYYDSSNSLIVDPTEDAIAEGVERMIHTPTDPAAISARHAQRSNEFRGRFTREVIGTIFRETGNRTPPENVIATSLRHKMPDFIPEKQAVAIIRGQT
ncbi:MAG TPA: glycosyltransferase [Kiritimatiellia bacterium]|nr:glycosyltransferase [Kiritimatiellia bacterium]